MAENYESVFLTGVRPKLGFGFLRCDHGSNFQNFDLEGLRTFTPMISKVSLHDVLLILAASRPKISIRSFYPRCDQMGQISKFFPCREYFGPELDASGPKSFPPGIFTHFGRPTAKNFDSVFLTKDRPNGLSFQILPIFAMGRPKWVKNSGGKLSRSLA